LLLILQDQDDRRVLSNVSSALRSETSTGIFVASNLKLVRTTGRAPKQSVDKGNLNFNKTFKKWVIEQHENI